MISQAAFRDAMARLAAAVHIVTTDGEAGRAGFTASAVSSVTDDPPTLLVCMHRGSRYNDVFKINGVLCVNVLGPEQADLSAAFGRKNRDLDSCFAAAEWRRAATGAPALAFAAVVFDCRIASIAEVGTHSVFFCEIVGVATRGDPAGVVYFDRSYHQLRTTSGETPTGDAQTALASVLEALGGADLPPRLYDWLQAAAPIDELFIFQRPLGLSTPPQPLMSLGRSPRLNERARAYCEDFYQLDPINELLPRDQPGATARIVPTQIAHRAYREICYERPNFREKISLWRRRSDGFVVVSMFRKADAKPFSSRELDAIRDCGRILFPIIDKHQSLTLKHGARPRPGETVLQNIETKLAALPVSLPPRQLAVCSRTLIGMTAKGIARDLGVKTSSVVTHRRRAYERLGISTGSELARLLL